MSMIGNLLRLTTAELEAYLDNSALLEDRIYTVNHPTQDPVLMDIDKSWDGLTFLLTGESFGISELPIAQIFCSNQVIDEEQDMGYGPAFYQTAAQVKELHQMLSDVSLEDMKANYVPGKMNDVYPSVWGDTEELNYLLEYFKIVQEVYATAASNGEAVIFFIN